MTVYLKKGSPYFQYDFWFKGERYNGTTKKTDYIAAMKFEDMIRRQVAGDTGPLVNHSLRRSQWRVYIIRGATTGLIKIGTAISIEQRLADLQCGSPDILELLWEGAGGYEAEAMAHREMAAHRSHGEWFRPEPPILKLIEVAIATDDITRAVLVACLERAKA